MASEHRGAEAPPLGRAAGSGGWPGAPGGRWGWGGAGAGRITPVACGWGGRGRTRGGGGARGTARIKRVTYGWDGRRRTTALGPDSAIRPAYMTATLFARDETTARSCET